MWEIRLLWLAHDCGPIWPDASRTVHAIGARNGVRFGGCLVHDRSTIWADASRSVDPVCASGGVALLGESERTKCNHKRQNNVFHYE
jgi:hypothetical protein